MIPEGYHYETRQKKDPPPPPKESPITFIIKIAISITFTIAITFTISIAITLFANFSDSNEGFSEEEVIGTGSGEDSDNDGEDSDNDGQDSDNDDRDSDNDDRDSDNDDRDFDNYKRVPIPRYCNGHYAGSANFRSSPALRPSAIKGVIPVGNYVLLTGEILPGDGVHWYRAINESNLLESQELGAQNQLGAGQIGWIAACFVR